MNAPVHKPDYLPFAREQQARFWAKGVRTPSGCIEWTGGRDKDGYGKFSVSLPRLNGKQQQTTVRAHRLAYELTHGALPGGALVLHECDNPSCFDPAHLKAGTQLQNRQDAVRRGRVPRGEQHHRAKLTEAQAREIVAAKRAGVSHTELARRFGVALATVGQVGTLYWRHVA